MTSRREQYGDEQTRTSVRRTSSEPDRSMTGSANAVTALRSVTNVPASMTQPADILALQRTMGNQAVSRMLQRQSAAPIQRDPTDDKKDQGKDKKVQGIDHSGMTPNFAQPLSQDAPTEYRVTVAVSQKVPEFYTFAKQRMKSTTRNEIRKKVKKVPGLGSLVRNPKSSQQIKERSAVKATGKPKGTSVNDHDVQKLLANSNSVGHSWIKMSPIGPNGSPIQTYSFGFVPKDLSQAHGPQQAIPGQVRNPDLEFEGYADFSNRYLNTTVTAKSYEAALKKIKQLTATPPNYRTSGYNCTQFAHDIAKAGGASFPSNAGMVVPFSDRGFMKTTMMPNALYDNMKPGNNLEDTSDERTKLTGGGFYEGEDGITARPVYVPPPKPRGLVLIDPMVDEDSNDSKVEIEKDEIIEPTGATFGEMLQVDYKGKLLYATAADLVKHLSQQEPTERDVYKLTGSLAVKTVQRATRTIPGGTDILVISVDDDKVTLESPQPSNIRGTSSLLAFWCAKAGVDIK